MWMKMLYANYVFIPVWKSELTRNDIYDLSKQSIEGFGKEWRGGGRLKAILLTKVGGI